MKRALCVGINDYPGTANDLHGCVNDANDWKNLLAGLGYTVQVLLNGQAKRAAILAALEELVVYANQGDNLVLTYSGHGTYTVDMSGDEVDGYDEALYVYDGMLIDDDIRAALDRANPGVHITVIFDSCFSGTATREILPGEYARRRFHPTVRPEDYKELTLPDYGNAKINKMLARAEMVEVYMSGCSDKEYSYDALIGGRYNGAFTRWAINTFKEGASFNEWHDRIREILPSEAWPQSPQLEGSESNKALTALDYGSAEPGPNPEPEPTPTPEPEKLRWWFWPMIAVVAIVLIALAIYLGR